MPKRKKTKTPVFYNPNNELNQYTDYCTFCTHLQYFDYQHLNEAGKPYPHDHPASHYLKQDEIEHHGDHCPDLHGNIEQKIKYHFKRIEEGMRDPYYHGSIAVKELEKRKLAREKKEKPTAEDELNEKHTIPEPAHPTNHKITVSTISGEDITKGLVSDNQASLLHKRIDKRKTEIHQLQDIVYDLIQVVQAHTESTTIPQELNRLLSSMREVKAVLANEKLDKYVTK